MGVIGKDKVAEDYPGDWGNLPLACSRQQGGGLDFALLGQELQKQITKAAGQHDDAVVAVMREVKSLLLQMEGK